MFVITKNVDMPFTYELAHFALFLGHHKDYSLMMKPEIMRIYLKVNRRMIKPHQFPRYMGYVNIVDNFRMLMHLSHCIDTRTLKQTSQWTQA